MNKKNRRELRCSKGTVTFWSSLLAHKEVSVDPENRPGEQDVLGLIVKDQVICYLQGSHATEMPIKKNMEAFRKARQGKKRHCLVFQKGRPFLRCKTIIAGYR